MGEPLVDAVARPTRRERARAATVAEIKQVALDLMRTQGTTDIRFADIARTMGLTAPALYRYYADRDALLTDLIAEGYHGLADVLAGAMASVGPGGDAATRLLAVAKGYRNWCLEDRLRFALLFGTPIPGYVAPEDGPTVEAAQRAFVRLAEVVIWAAQNGELGEPIVKHVDQVTAAAMTADEWPEVLGEPLALNVHQAMIHGWAALHGFVTLEAYGHLDGLTPQGRDGMFVAQVELIARSIGLRMDLG